MVTAPENFDGALFRDAYAVTPEIVNGIIANAPISATQADIDAMVVDTKAQMVDALWTHADQIASSIADQNARARFLAWLIDPATPAPAKDLITQLQAAMDSIWAQYAAGKAAILAGNEPAPITATADLPTFWDVAAAAAQG